MIPAPIYQAAPKNAIDNIAILLYTGLGDLDMSKLIVELSPELHESLKRRSALLGKTLKQIVTDLVQAFLLKSSAGEAKKTGFCGAWKDSRGAAAVLKDIKAHRSWFQRAR